MVTLWPLPSSPATSEPTCVSQVCVGPRRVGGADGRQLVTCILCQEEQEVRGQGRAMVLAAFVQRSTVLSKNRRRSLPDPGELVSDIITAATSQWSAVIDRHVRVFQNIMTRCSCTPSCRWAFTPPAADTSCTPPAGRGETMQSVTSLRVETHSTCVCVRVCRYFEAVQLKEQRRQQRLRGHNSYDVENGEFLCPLCECLSNTVIPLLPHTHTPDRRYTYTQSHRYTNVHTPGPCTFGQRHVLV